MSKKSAFDINHQQNSTGSKIVVALERIAEAFRVLLWNESKVSGLSPLQLQLLVFLLHHPHAHNRKVGHLAAEFNMTKATVSDAVKTLLSKGLLQKSVDQADSRSCLLNLTAEGFEIARKASLFTSEIQTSIEHLSEEEQANLLLSLLSIIRHLNLAGVITVQRMCFNCTHFRANHDDHTYFCKLLNAPLSASQLRVDCPDHAPAS